jgi:tRNA modification GTPase
MLNSDTICAVATASGAGAIAVIRLSGENALEIADRIFVSKNKSKQIRTQKNFSILFGTVFDNETPIDEVLISVFRAPHSYSGEDIVEISCHGSLFIQQKILNVLIKNGARNAFPGEYTQRAFLNGKMDLSQAEAVADLISSSSAAAHRVALNQMRGGFSNDIKTLREKLLTFISLIELELDFSEEEVTFADRVQLKNLILEIESKIETLVESFELGNAIKNGIPVAIVGEPNVGKSTLLNVLLNEDKAIVSEIAGTTRDAIEDVISLKGILFRFTDTAGIRETEDTIENLGIERTMQKIEKAEIVLLMIDAADINAEEKVRLIRQRIKTQKLIIVVNKIDHSDKHYFFGNDENTLTVEISAKFKQNIGNLENALLQTVHYTSTNQDSTIITNQRHFEVLNKALLAACRVKDGIESHISGDFLAQDIREIMFYFGEISGQITDNEVLGNIFKNFCIGK